MYICVVHGLGGIVGSIATSFDEDMSLKEKLVLVSGARLEERKVPSTRLFVRNSCHSWDKGTVSLPSESVYDVSDRDYG